MSDTAGALCRYLTETAAAVPLGLHTRLMAPADAPLLLMALLDEPPWECRSEKGVTHRFEGGVWQPADRLRLGQIAVQVSHIQNICTPLCTKSHRHRSVSAMI